MAQLRHCPSLNRVLYIPAAFTPDECQSIIDDALAHWHESDGRMTVKGDAGDSDHSGVDADYRHSTVFMPQEPQQWLCERILATIANVNGQPNGYGFELIGLCEPPCLMRYESAEVSKQQKAGKYDWHMDLGHDALTSTRKISYSVLLNGGQYQGGDLNFLIDRDPRTYGDQTRVGTMVIFPSYLMHCVDEVTQGTRYALVGWVHGNSFR